jgi:uncharacterized membrane protein
MRRMRVLVAICAMITALFVLTGPWTLGPVSVRHLEHVLPVWLVLLLHPRFRALLRGEVRFSRKTLILALIIVFAFLLRVTVSKWQALEVNAWDFSFASDRPIERTVHGQFLWSEDLGKSMLKVHCNWLLLAFVPLYALLPSPWWLLIAQAAAIAAGVAALFHFTRAAFDDDVLAACVALAFLLNRYTARATQFIFIIDVFYPVALLVLFHAFLQKKKLLFLFALLLTVSIKEDAIVPLTGFALVAAIGYRRWRWAAAAMAAAVPVFLADYFVVLSGSPWYGSYWASYGATPLAALLGIVASPWKVLQRVFGGSIDIFLSLALVPIAGWSWILAALPPLVLYGASDARQLHYFVLHYSMPLLPGLFAAIPFGAHRIARGNGDRRRIIGIVVLITSALVGSTYELDEPKEERKFIRPLVAESGSRALYVQGALLPHAGYADNVRALHHKIQPPANSAYLLCETCNPYPFTPEEHRARIDALRSSGRYQEIRRGSLMLFR